MAFQFQCPQGHLLEGDESQAGQQCQCPECGMLFIIPAPVSVPGVQGSVTDPMQPADFPGVTDSSDDGEQAPTDPYGATATGAQMFHIPCPNGHELETPPDMLNQDVMCPHCGVRFQLREKDSIEYKRRKREETERAERKAGSAWLNWAIVFAVMVVLGLVILIIVSANNN